MEVSLDRQQGANAWLTVGIREGRNREIRRAMEHVGLSVNRLIRVSYGPFQLGKLKAGEVEEVRRKIMYDQLGLTTPDDTGRAKPKDAKPSFGKKFTGRKPTDRKPTDGKPTDGKPTDRKSTDRKPFGGKPSDRGPSGSKPSRPKSAAPSKGPRKGPNTGPRR
jgi:23S rRNA pseudouridine2605 synthase